MLPVVSSFSKKQLPLRLYPIDSATRVRGVKTLPSIIVVQTDSDLPKRSHLVCPKTRGNAGTAQLPPPSCTPARFQQPKPLRLPAAFSLGYVKSRAI